MISQVEPTADSVADGSFAHPEPPADADKENDVTVRLASSCSCAVRCKKSLLDLGRMHLCTRASVAAHVSCLWRPPTPYVKLEHQVVC